MEQVVEELDKQACFNWNYGALLLRYSASHEMCLNVRIIIRSLDRSQTMIQRSLSVKRNRTSLLNGRSRKSSPFGCCRNFVGISLEAYLGNYCTTKYLAKRRKISHVFAPVETVSFAFTSSWFRWIDGIFSLLDMEFWVHQVWHVTKNVQHFDQSPPFWY